MLSAPKIFNLPKTPSAPNFARRLKFAKSQRGVNGLKSFENRRKKR